MDKYKVIAIFALIVFLLIVIVLSSRTRIIKTYSKYMRVDNKLNITGKQLAFFAKDHLQLHDLSFALTDRKLGDAYNYKYKTLIMNQDVSNTASIASLTIVAHELGHAMQHRDNAPLFNINVLLNRITRFTSALIVPLLILGLFFHIFQYPSETFGYVLMIIAGCLFFIQILDKLLDIPLEYNASRRGLNFLKDNDLLTTTEYYRAKKLLGIAAQTYIASLFDNLLVIKKKRKRKK